VPAVPELPYVGDPEEAAFQRRYGPWLSWTPAQAAELLAGWDRPWWVVGGRAIDAFTGTQREHEDLDIGIMRAHVPHLQAYLGEEWHCWAVGSKNLRALVPEDAELPEWADQCWLRRHAWSPWVMDVITNPDVDGSWVFRRDPQVVLPLEAVVWELDGTFYQQPQIVLAFKALAHRDKDTGDLERAWPLMDETQRTWLRSTVARLHPGHSWLRLLG
jgi:hypothetical protein